MSIRITVTDEQTGESQTRRVAEGDYAVIAVHPCFVDRFEEIKKGTGVITVKNWYPQTLLVIGEDKNGS